MSEFNIKNNELTQDDVYCMGNCEYDKITVTTSPKDILSHLMKISRPVGDELVSLESDTWHNIQLAIKLIMHDESKGSTDKDQIYLINHIGCQINSKLSGNSDTKQLETING